MALFHNQAAKAFATRVADLFTPAAIYYVHVASSQALTEQHRVYQQAFAANGAAKKLGNIILPDAAILPYLTVRSNLLINGQKVPFEILPESFRRDTLFLDQTAKALTAEQSLYVQLFREILAARPFLLMPDFPSDMSPQERRQFIDYAEPTIKASKTSLILLTQDEKLIAANPTHSFAQAPALTVPAAKVTRNVARH